MSLTSNNIIISDLDGTLLDKHSQIPSKFVHLLDVIASHNDIFVIATARSPQNVFNLFKNHLTNGLDFIAICHDGAVICNMKNQELKILYEKTHKLSDFSMINKITLKNIDHLWFSSSQNNFNVYHLDSLKHKNVLKELIPFRTLVSSSDESFDQVRAFTLFGEFLLLKKIHKQLLKKKEFHSFELSLYEETRIMGNYGWIDFTDGTTSKGAAVINLMEELYHIENQRIVCLGNSFNDMSMFEVADLAICPSNVDKIIKDKVDIVCNSTNGEKFVEEVIKHIYE